jgi:hypothetical protein
MIGRRCAHHWHPGCISTGSEVFSNEVTRGDRQMKVLLVDDHALIRDGLRGVVKDLAQDATVLEASDSRLG